MTGQDFLNICEKINYINPFHLFAIGEANFIKKAPLQMKIEMISLAIFCGVSLGIALVISPFIAIPLTAYEVIGISTLASTLLFTCVTGWGLS